LLDKGIGVKECGLDFGMVVFNNTKIEFLGDKGNRRIGKTTNAGLHVRDR